MGKMEQFFNTPVGGGRISRGRALGAVGAGVQGVQMHRAQAAGWAATAEQFEQFGPDGQKIAAMIRKNPRTAELHAKRMGGWGNLYAQTRGGFHRRQLASSIERARESGDVITGREAQDVSLQGLRAGIPQGYINAVLGQGELDFGATLRQLSPYHHTPESIAAAMAHWRKTGDAAASAGLLKRVGKGGWPTGTPELAKILDLYEAEDEPVRKRAYWDRIQKMTTKSTSGRTQESRAKSDATIRTARNFVASRIAEWQAAGTPITRAMVFGKEPVMGGYFNPKDPLLAMMITKAKDKMWGESQAEHQAYLAYLHQVAPLKAGMSSAPDLGVPGPEVESEQDAELERRLDSLINPGEAR
jgi:hypothetical protein